MSYVDLLPGTVIVQPGLCAAPAPTEQRARLDDPQPPPPKPVDIDQIVRKILARPGDEPWTDAIRAVLREHVGEVIRP